MEETIDETNFENYFFDARRYAPQQGQVMAKYHAVAEFIGGQAKRDVIGLLKTGKTHQASQVMRRIHLAKEPDCYRVLREMSEDLLSGKSEAEVEDTPYEFEIEAFYYTDKENVPKDDLRWETIELMSFDPESNTYRSVIELPENAVSSN